MSKARLDWIVAKGGQFATHTNVNDATFAYMKNKSGLANGTVNDHIMKTLNNLGYTTGTINDRLLAFYRAKTGLPTATFQEAEKAFYANNSLDFA